MSLFSQLGKLSSVRRLPPAIALLLLCAASLLSPVNSNYLTQSTRLDASLNQRRAATYKWVAQQEPPAGAAPAAEPATTPEQNASTETEKQAPTSSEAAPVQAEQTPAAPEVTPAPTGEVSTPMEAPPASVDVNSALVSEPEQISVVNARKPAVGQQPPEDPGALGEPEASAAPTDAAPPAPESAEADPPTTSPPAGEPEQPEGEQVVQEAAPSPDEAPQTPEVSTPAGEVAAPEPEVPEPASAQQEPKPETAPDQEEAKSESVPNQEEPKAESAPVQEEPEPEPPSASVEQPEAPTVGAGSSERAGEPKSVPMSPMPPGSAVGKLDELETSRENVVPRIVSYDLKSCASLGELPSETLGPHVNRILDSLGGQNCSQQVELQLRPRTNKQVRGRVMEVGPMRVRLDELLASSHVNVLCSVPAAGERVQLTLVLELGERHLRSRWRSYSSLQPNEIPFGETFGRQASKNLLEAKQTDGCQRFRVEQGHFQLALHSPEVELSLSLELAKNSSERARLQGLRLSQAYLEHEIEVQAGRHYLGGPLDSRLATVQILHDRNNHHRRNNWLLDLYGNWLRHEYRRQLGSAKLGGPTLVRQLNALCLSV